jgi:hypothetical protein
MDSLHRSSDDIVLGRDQLVCTPNLTKRTLAFRQWQVSVGSEPIACITEHLWHCGKNMTHSARRRE